MRIYAVFGDNAVMIEYSYGARKVLPAQVLPWCTLHQSIRQHCRGNSRSNRPSVGNCPAEPGYTGVPQTREDLLCQ